MITYRMNLSDEKKDAALEIALMSPANVRRRRIGGTILVLLGIVLVICGSGLMFLEKKASGIVYLIMGVVALAFGLRTKAFQRFILKRSEKLLDKAFRSGVVEYGFDDEGVHIRSHLGNSLCYWDSFVEQGTMGQYLYMKRGDNKLILVDKNDLTASEFAELIELLKRHMPAC